SFGFNPTSASFDYHANASSVTCTKSPFPSGGVYTGCAWVASSNASWINLTGNTSSDMAGSRNVPYSITANFGQPRSGTITFSSGQYGSATFTVNQGSSSSSACTSFAAVGPQNILISDESTNVTWNFTTTPASCSWTASGSSLIQTISPSSGN